MRPRLLHELQLRDPGLVPNSRTDEHCVHACFQMIFRTAIGLHVPSFAEFDTIMKKEEGKYTWEHGLISLMPAFGFDTKVIWTLDLKQLSHNTEAYLLSHYGDEVGKETIKNSNLITVAEGAERLLRSEVLIEFRSPTLEDTIALLTDGYYLMFTVNQRVLQADPGYVAHNIVAYGVSERGIRIHNPGSPATAATELSWELFDKSWSFPDDNARNIFAFRPRNASR